MSQSAAQLAKSVLHVTATHRGEERQRVFYKRSLILGRPHGPSEPDFDLSPDNNVSRNHARLLVENQMCLIEDLGSTFGTRVDAQDIRGKGRVRIDATSQVQLGDTELKVKMLVDTAGGFPELPPQPALASSVEVRETISSPGHSSLPKLSTLETVGKETLLLEILIQFSLPSPLDQLLQTIVARVVDLVPGAKRGTLLLLNPATNGLLMAAFVSRGEPAVSETLARRALQRQQAFIWQDKFGTDLTMSIHRHQIQSGMYAPLIYDGRPLGVLAVDNPDSDSAFSDQDLQLLVVVADHAAMAVSHHQLREELKEKSMLVEELLTNLPQQVRERLREKVELRRFIRAM